MFALHLIPGHGNKGSRDDPGAGADVDGDGTVERHEHEAPFVRDWAGRMEAAAAWRGWPCFVYGIGGYKTRNAQCKTRIASMPTHRHVVLYLHLNAVADTRANHSMINRHPDSTFGQVFMPIMANAWDTHLSSMTRGNRPTKMRAYTGQEHQQWKRNCAAVVGPSFGFPGQSFGLLLEPWFLSALTNLGEGIYQQWMQATVMATVMGLVRIEEAWK